MGSGDGDDSGGVRSRRRKPYWVVERLLGVGKHYWADLDGYTTAHGGPDLRELPIRRFCSLVWWFITRNAETETDIEKLRERIWLPPKGEKGQGVWSAEAETDSFHSLMTDLGVDEQ